MRYLDDPPWKAWLLLIMTSLIALVIDADDGVRAPRPNSVTLPAM
jgi:hypothetical protein